MLLNAQTTVSIAGQRFEHFHSLTLQQSIYGHHSFRLLTGHDWLQHPEQGLLDASRTFLGQEASIVITPVEDNGHYGTLSFHGIVTAVHAGKESDGMHGCCVIKGGSPTLLLENEPHIQSFEELPLAEIVRQSLRPCGPYMGPPLIAPHTSAPLKYIVQYRESNFAFLQRLSQRFGEWFFYDGRQVVFGRYAPRTVTLIHQVNLLDFDLELRALPNNTLMSAYEYRQDALVTGYTGWMNAHMPAGHTAWMNAHMPANHARRPDGHFPQEAQVAGHTLTQVPGHFQAPAAGDAGSDTDLLNAYTRHASQVSGRLYNRPSLYKPYQALSEDAKTQITRLAALHKRARTAQLVRLEGHSWHPGLRPGDIAAIQESVLSMAHHGEFLITHLEHHCTGSGEYHNSFSGIPADTAAPAPTVASVPYCEQQSAVVTDNNDPKGLGRVRVRFRWQQQGASPWARVIVPHGGKDKGLYFIPEKGEEVWVDFEGGNPEAPFVLGAAYNGHAGMPPGTQNNLKIIRTRSGHTIQLDDSKGEENIVIKDKSGNAITLDTSGKSVAITAPETIRLSARHISIQAEEHVDIHAGQDIQAHAGANVHISATASHTVQAAGISCEATGSMRVSAAEMLEQRAGNMQLYTTLGDIRIIGSGTTVVQGGKQVKISKG